jgi:uncharacterized membrane protein (DUF2068 family)
VERPRALKAIIAYKFVKAPIMLALALLLTVAPAKTTYLAKEAAITLQETGALGWRLAHWLEPHLNRSVERKAAVLAWLDGASTLVEGLLLLSGSAWGEWIVVAGLAALLPIEALGFARHPHAGHALVLLINAAVVAYLARRRLKLRTAAAV